MSLAARAEKQIAVITDDTDFQMTGMDTSFTDGDRLVAIVVTRDFTSEPTLTEPVGWRILDEYYDGVGAGKAWLLTSIHDDARTTLDLAFDQSQASCYVHCRGFYDDDLGGQLNLVFSASAEAYNNDDIDVLAAAAGTLGHLLACGSWFSITTRIDQSAVAGFTLGAGYAFNDSSSDRGCAAIQYDLDGSDYAAKVVPTVGACSWAGWAVGLVSVKLNSNEITDATRAANVEGDGLPATDSSVGIWEGTENVLDNGGFETDTTDWSSQGASIARDTGEFKFGAASLEVTPDGAAGSEGAKNDDWDPVSVSDVRSVSAWIKGTATDTLNIGLDWFDSGFSYLSSSVLTPTITTGWVRYSVTATAPASAAWVATHWYSNAAGASVFYMDGVQLEFEPIVTPYKETDGGGVVRNNPQVEIPASLVDETQSWVCSRMRMGWGAALPSGIPAAHSWGDDGSNRILNYFTGDNVSFWSTRADAGSATFNEEVVPAHSIGDKRTFVFAWTATVIKQSTNGAAFTSGGNTDIPTLSETLLTLGAYDVGGPDNFFDSDYFWVLLGTGTLTDGNSVTLDGYGDTDPTAALGFGTPTGFWRCDDNELIVDLPVNVIAPTVSGLTPVGSTLTADVGEWDNDSDPLYSYQWTRGGIDIGGATSSTYVTVEADAGEAIGCDVIATNPLGASAEVGSSNEITVDAGVPDAGPSIISILI